MKKEIIDDMNTRFADVAAQPLYAVATLVDPRCSGKLLRQSEFATAKQWLVDAVGCVVWLTGLVEQVMLLSVYAKLDNTSTLGLYTALCPQYILDDHDS